MYGIMKRKCLIGLVAVVVVAAVVLCVKLMPLGMLLSALGGFFVGFAAGWIGDELKHRYKKA